MLRQPSLPQMPSPLKYLQRLDLSSCTDAMNDVSRLPNLVSLEHLFLESCGDTTTNTSYFIDFLASLEPTLKTLDLRANYKLKGPNIAELVTRQPNITNLNLSGCIKLTDECLAFVSSLKYLQYLDLAGCKGTPDGLAHLSRLMFLQSLNLCGCDITNEHIKYLAEVKSLGDLNLSQCNKITKFGVRHLKCLEFLRVLNLHNCWQLGNQAMKHLAEMKLRLLDVSGCMIGDPGVAFLAGIGTLRSLNLSACVQVTDASIAHLAGTNLHSLDLSRCSEITNVGVSSLPPLLELNLYGCANVSFQ